MGILKAVIDSVSGTLADQFRDMITCGKFEELTIVALGILKSQNNGRGENYKSSNYVISNGSIIFVPENTAAVIYSQGYIENIITKPGGYEYQNGEKSIFTGGDILDTIFDQTKDRIRFGGISSQEKKIVFFNLRELRGILFGTKGPQVYHDKFYDTDLEITVYGSFSIKLIDVEKFIKNFLPANTNYYSFEDIQSKVQIVNEFIQSLIVVLNTMSRDYRVSELPSQAKSISDYLINDKENVGTWEDRYGFKIVKVAIENIEYTDKSKELINKFNESKMSMKAYDGVTQNQANISAHQKIAEGAKDKGLGSGGAGLILGMNMAQNVMPNNMSKMNVHQQMETLKNMKELFDAGLLTKEEFELKKKQLLSEN